MKKLIKAGLPLMTAFATLSAVLLACKPASGADSPAKEPLAITLPEATLKGTPSDPPSDTNIDPVATKLPVFMVPKGVKNVALNKPVTSSVPPFTGELTQITDGKKEAADSDAVEFKKGPQWVQVDLGASYPLYAIAVWHDHRYLQVMKAVVLQVSDDPEFKKDVTTLLNNDVDNVAGQGAGTDREYFETRFGRIIDAKGVKARYIRGYTKGSSMGALNCWQEIEAYALPAN
jgi:hypothetical protein